MPLFYNQLHNRISEENKTLNNFKFMLLKNVLMLCV